MKVSVIKLYRNGLIFQNDCDAAMAAFWFKVLFVCRYFIFFTACGTGYDNTVH
jgi:hypothetical protein